jgi:leukotriene-A4 hydrolase
MQKSLTVVFLTVLLGSLSFWSCRERAQPTDTMTQLPDTLQAPEDVHSFARPAEAVVTHLDLDIAVDFTSKTIAGEAQYQIENKGQADRIVLDSRNLQIKKVLLNGKEETSFSLGAEEPFLGQPLEIALKPDTKTISIFYQTSPGAAALQWLEPQQTAGGKHPFLFTQSQAVLARTWIPIQDSPGIRFTYNARVKVPKGLLAVMSAENPVEKNEEGLYKLSMRQPIPSYLMALAVGDLVFEPLGEQTGVYAEPATIKEAAHEFAELDEMLDAAEQLYGAYQWGRYDLLVLPPSFPFGGMENPRLTFVTPTILARDRSLTSLIAHELAHSWSGNLVTNATWNDFWLNEGFTVYFERRIMEALYGPDYAQMLQVLGQQDLQHTLEDLGADSPDTRLKLDLAGRDPDEGLTDIAYEKGNFFLLNLEQAVGRERFDQFMNKYFKTFAFQTTHTEKFINFLESELIKGDSALARQINVQGWIHEPGIPDGAPVPTSSRFQAVERESLRWRGGTPADQLNTRDWSSHEWLHFIRLLPNQLTPKQMQELDDAFRFTSSGNSEILAAWLTLAIRHQYKPADEALEQFLTTVGRRKFLSPLYKALLATPAGRQKALKIYQKARPQYHYVATSTFDELLKWQEQ